MVVWTRGVNRVDRRRYCPGESDARSSLFNRRHRCQSLTSLTCISDLTYKATNSHIDYLFCTTQSQQQQDEGSLRSSSGISSSDSSRHHHGDGATSCHVVDEVTEWNRRRPTVDEMFCTQRSTSDNSASLQTPPITDQRCDSYAGSNRKQASQSFDRSVRQRIRLKAPETSVSTKTSIFDPIWPQDRSTWIRCVLKSW